MSGNIVPGQKRPLSLRDGKATPAFGFGNGADSLLCLPNTVLNGGFEPEARLGSSPFEPVPAGTAGGPLRREVLVPCQHKKTLHSSKIGSLLPTGVWRGLRETNSLRERQAEASLWNWREGTACPGCCCVPSITSALPVWAMGPSTAPQCHIPVSHPPTEKRLSLCTRIEPWEHLPEPTAP